MLLQTMGGGDATGLDLMYLVLNESYHDNI